MNLLAQAITPHPVPMPQVGRQLYSNALDTIVKAYIDTLDNTWTWVIAIIVLFLVVGVAMELILRAYYDAKGYEQPTDISIGRHTGDFTARNDGIPWHV